MAARAIYKARLVLGTQGVSVKLYSAVEDRSVHFRLLHQADGVPVQQRMVEPNREEAVPREVVRRAIPVGDSLVELTEQERERLQPVPSREIEVLRFVPAGALQHPWYVRPYYLGPDGGTGAYFALAEALAEEKREGIVRWVMRGKEYRGVLRVEGGYLMLVTLRHAEEVIEAEQLPAPTGRELDERELKMASQLVEMLADSFDPAAYADEYRDRLAALLDEKARGVEVTVRAPTLKTKPESSLVEALQASIAQHGHGKKKKRKVA